MKIALVPIFFLCWMNLLAQDSAKITYISNEVFLLETQGKKVLIDGLFAHMDENWYDSPSEENVALMEASAPPFDLIDLIAVTHKHRDHFDDQIVLHHMLNNQKAMLICPEQAADLLAEHADFEKIKARVIALTPGDCMDSSLVVSGIPVRVMRLEHSYYMEEDSLTGTQVNRHRDIVNLGYLFDIEGFKAFHCGDTNPLNEKEYSTFALQHEAIDIAFLERMFVTGGGKGMDIINKYIQPEHIVFMHINPANRDLFIKHFKELENITIFEAPMESIYYETSK